MAEYIRSVVVTIVVDTNKQTRERRIEKSYDETREEFEQRVVEMIAELTECS